MLYFFFRAVSHLRRPLSTGYLKSITHCTRVGLEQILIVEAFNELRYRLCILSFTLANPFTNLFRWSEASSHPICHSERMPILLPATYVRDYYLQICLAQCSSFSQQFLYRRTFFARPVVAPFCLACSRRTPSRRHNIRSSSAISSNTEVSARHSNTRRIHRSRSPSTLPRRHFGQHASASSALLNFKIQWIR